MGITYYDADIPGAGSKTIIGGFFRPSVEAIEALRPDVIFISGIHKEVNERFGGKECQLILTETTSDIAGWKIAERRDFFESMDLPIVVKMAMNSILNGIYSKKNPSEGNSPRQRK